MTSEPVTIFCMKWGNKFGPHYVNRLHAMVRRFLQRPHRFVCLTDDGEGLHPEITVLPLPDMTWNEGIRSWGWWKVGLFSESEHLGGLTGRALFLDLDVVITGPIDDLFTYPGTILLPRDYRRVRVRGDDYVGNTSVLRFEIGQHVGLMEQFRAENPPKNSTLRNEQEYVSRYFHQRGELSYWPSGWCPSFKRHCVRPWPLSHFLTPRLPEGAKVVVFHGHPNPAEALAGQSHRWYRPIRPTPWVADYWTEEPPGA